MRRLVFTGLLAAGFLALCGSPAPAQEVSDFLSVGEVAPDIELKGATRHGVLAKSVSLSDLRGETIVLAFFFKARTGG